MTKKPFAYTVIDREFLAFQTLADLVAASRHDSISDTHVLAHFPGGDVSQAVPRTAYSVPAPPSEAEALAFIRKRAADIAMEAAKWGTTHTGISQLLGIGRCHPDDPEDEQVADYIASAPWAWRDHPDEGWWEETP